MGVGIDLLGTIEGDNLLASSRPPRTRTITLAGGQGLLRRGTLVQKDDSGKYVICDDVDKMAGVLLEDIDTGSSSSVNFDFYAGIDADLNLNAVYSSVTSLPDDFYYKCGLNIK